MQFDLPQNLQTEIPQPDLGILIDPESCNTSWQAVADHIKRLYDTCAALETAINRQHYARLASLNTLGRKIDVIEEKLQYQKREGFLSPVYDIDWNPNLYIHSHADVSTGDIKLPVLRERLLKPARVNVTFPGALEYEYDNPATLRGDIWRATVRAGQPLRLPPSLPWADDYGAACHLEIVFPRTQALNYIALQPVVLPPVDLILVSLVDKYGAVQKLCAPSREGRVRSSAPLTDPVELLFPDVIAKAVCILLYQRHGRRIEAGDGRMWYEYYFGLAGLRIGLQERSRKAQWVSLPMPVTADTRAIYCDADIERLEAGQVEFDVVADGNRGYPILPISLGNKPYNEQITVVAAGEGWQGRLRFPAREILAVHEGGRLLEPDQDYTLTDGQVLEFLQAPLEKVIASYYPADDALRINLKDLCQEQVEEFAGTGEDGRINLQYPVFTDYNLIASLPETWDPSLLDGDYTPVEVTIYTPDGSVLTQPTIRNITPYRSGLPTGAENDIVYVVEGDSLRFNQPLEQDNRVVVRYQRLPRDIRLSTLIGCNTEVSTQAGPQVSNMGLYFIRGS